MPLRVPRKFDREAWRGSRLEEVGAFVGGKTRRKACEMRMMGVLLPILLLTGCGGAVDLTQPDPVAPEAPTRTATVTAAAGKFSPAFVTIAQGGTVTWRFGGPHTVTFTGSAPPGGSIPLTGAGNAVSLRFAKAGDYDYVCTRHLAMGMRGVVHVEGRPRQGDTYH